MDPHDLENLLVDVVTRYNSLISEDIPITSGPIASSTPTADRSDSIATIDPDEPAWRVVKEISTDSSDSSFDTHYTTSQKGFICTEMSKKTDKSVPDDEKIGWALESVIDYYLSDPDIAADLTRPDFNGLLSIETEWVNVIKKALEYQGFDPIVIIKTMINNKKAFIAKKTQMRKYDMTNISGDFEVKSNSLDKNIISNDSPMMRDVVVLLMVFQARSSHISKVLKKSYSSMADVLGLLIEKYDINDDVRASGTQMGSKVVTLPRIAACFPSTAVTLFHYKKAKFIVPQSSFPDCEGLENLSPAICCPLLVSVCPDSILKKDGNNLHPLMFWLAVKVDDVIHRKEKNYTDLNELLQYYKASYKSNATPEKARLEMFCHLGFMNTASTDFKPALIRLATKCMDELTGMRRDDPDHDVVMRAIKDRDLE